jgi:phosphatidate cytidylyltransferase
MLWQRLLTAAVLVPFVIAGILYLQTPTFALVLGALILAAGLEMGRLAGVRQTLALVVYVAAIALAMWLVWRYLAAPYIESLQWIMTLWWLTVTAALIVRRRELSLVESVRPGILALGGLVLVAAWASIVTLHAAPSLGPALVLFLFVLIWIADSGAYFAGRAFGRRKLSPFVSPGKTWAGVSGAAFGAMLAGLVLALSPLTPDAQPVLALTLLCIVVTLVSIGGDLWESRLKREAGVKDSGNLLPGHGGMLDRIDSLLAAAPVFGLGFGLLGGGG